MPGPFDLAQRALILLASSCDRSAAAHRIDVSRTAHPDWPRLTFLFLLAFTPIRVQAIAFLVLLWVLGAFILYPRPVTVLFGHFEKKRTWRGRSTIWFLTLFPREKPFLANAAAGRRSVHPDPGDDDVGVWCGEWLRLRAPPATTEGTVARASALALAGLLLQVLHLCPIVKRIWTSSTRCTAGLVILLLAVFYASSRSKAGAAGVPAAGIGATRLPSTS